MIKTAIICYYHNCAIAIQTILIFDTSNVIDERSQSVIFYYGYPHLLPRGKLN